MKWLWIAAVATVGTGCGGDGGGGVGPDASSSTDDAPSVDAMSEERPPDPADPVEDVPPFQGAYSFGKLTTQDNIQFGDSGTWFTDSTSEHRVTTTRVRYARYRDGVVLQDKDAGRVFVYDQATTMVGPEITLPADAVGFATIRGGLIYIGGLGKVYSYEIATQMWRMRELPGAGTCVRAAAGTSRLFVLCASASAANTDVLYSTWANKTMSDVVPLGSVSPGVGAEFAWLTTAPGQDVAYFESRSPGEGCIGKATTTTLEPCAIPVRTLGSGLAMAYLKRGELSEDGRTLYVTMFFDSSESPLYAIQVATMQYKYIRPVESFATCPDNSVVYQDGTISERYAGGVTSEVRLGAGGEYDMGCPLRPL